MNVLVLLVALFTLFNVLISIYMTYLTIDIALTKCKCAVLNFFWFLIFFYFLFTFVFLLYSLLVILQFARGYKFIYFIIGYVIATIIFAIGSFYYTRYLTSKRCGCVKNEFTKTLRIITFLRLLMAIITGIALISWGLYLILQKHFMSKM